MLERQAMNTDTPETLESAASLLRKGLRHFEVISHLDQIPATGALIVVARPGPEGSSGFRVRAFAILPRIRSVRDRNRIDGVMDPGRRVFKNERRCWRAFAGSLRWTR